MLIWSAFISSILAFLYLALIGYSIYFFQARNLGPAILLTILFTSFFLHSLFIIFFLKKYYPAREIPAGYRISFKIIITVVALFLSFLIMGGIILILSEQTRRGFGVLEDRTSSSILLISLLIICLAQFHMLWEGNWLEKTIAKNFRGNLIDSL